MLSENLDSNQFLLSFFLNCCSFSRQTSAVIERQIQNKAGKNWFESGFYRASIFNDLIRRIWALNIQQCDIALYQYQMPYEQYVTIFIYSFLQKWEKIQHCAIKLVFRYALGKLEKFSFRKNIFIFLWRELLRFSFWKRT